MSEFKSNDERIECLERQVAGLIDIQKQLLALMKSQQEAENMKIKWMIQVVDDHQALAKFICSQPTIGSQSQRVQWLTELAQAKKNWDEVVLPFLRLTLLPPLPPMESSEPPSD